MVTSSPLVPGVGTAAAVVVAGWVVVEAATVAAGTLVEEAVVLVSSTLSLMGICRPREVPYDDPAPTVSPPLLALEGGTSVVASRGLEEEGSGAAVPPADPLNRPRCGVSWTIRRET